MKEFNLQAALNGDPVITLDGRKVIQMAYFPEAVESHQIYALLEREDMASAYYINGKDTENEMNGCDLFMAPRKKKLFIAIKKTQRLDGFYETSNAHESKEKIHHDDDRIVVEVEIEE